MTQQFPIFRHTVALQMDGYNERIAERIKRHRERRGEDPEDAARRAAVSLRTYERWEAAERKPQLKNLKALADSWDVDLEALRPDLEEDAERLERIEAKLDLLLDHAGLPVDFDSIADRLQTRIAQGGPRGDATQPRTGEPSP